MHEFPSSIESQYLYPSAIIVSAYPKKVITVLGSCVSVCLWDPILMLGGINHYMLPYWNGSELASPKYGNIAINKLIEKMQDLGSKKVNLIAKVFGGGEVIDISSGSFQIGQRNIDLAFELLSEHKIPIVAHSTGGQFGRKLVYLTSTGTVCQKMLIKT